jgi:hypothetical protein
MSRVTGSLAWKLDFGEMEASAGRSVTSGRRPLRLAALAQGGRLTGPDKYQVLERRRRRAQIAARRQLALLD